MTKKALDQKNRWRSKTVAFRVSPEEWEEISRLVRLSGMTKQEYILHRLQNKQLTVQANPRVRKALQEELTKCQSHDNILSEITITDNQKP